MCIALLSQGMEKVLLFLLASLQKSRPSLLNLAPAFSQRHSRLPYPLNVRSLMALDFTFSAFSPLKDEEADVGWRGRGPMRTQLGLFL